MLTAHPNVVLRCVYYAFAASLRVVCTGFPRARRRLRIETYKTDGKGADHRECTDQSQSPTVVPPSAKGVAALAQTAWVDTLTRSHRGPLGPHAACGSLPTASGSRRGAPSEARQHAATSADPPADRRYGIWKYLNKRVQASLSSRKH